MADITVSYADLEASAAELRAGQADIEERLTALQGRIQRLVSDGYVTGRSSVAFARTYDDFTRGVAQTVRGLEGLSSFLTSASRVLADTDQALASGLGG
jgi:WXG100 family type VII secretion target